MSTEVEGVVRAESFDAGEFPALDELEARAPASGDMSDGLLEASLLDRARGVPSTDHALGIARRDGVRDRERARGKGVTFEHAHRAVPEDGLRAASTVA